MVIDFSGYVMFLTGASKGIGKKIKDIFEESGATVISPGRDELDLKSAESIDAYFRKHKNIKVDMFVHCAGVNELAGIETINNDIIESVFNVNCFSAIHILKYLSKSMKNNKWGRVVFISSLYAIISRENRIAYSASKNAMTGVMKSLCLELAQDNILVNSIAPGYVMTDMTKKNLSDKEIDDIKGLIPLGKFQSEEDIANSVAFLCSNLNNSITGQLIAVDGGFTCR